MATDYRVDDDARLLIQRLREQAERRIKRLGLTGARAINERAKVELVLGRELKRKG